MNKPKLSVRLPPQPVDPKLAEQFIATGEVSERTQTSEDSQEPLQAAATVHSMPIEPRLEGSQTSVGTRGKALVERQGGRVRRRMTLYLPPDLADRFMTWCTDNGREASHAAGQAIAAFLSVHQKG